jgi:muramidase (phage lysozyme)
MKYARNYLNASTLAERIKASVAQGSTAKAAGGLAARQERRAEREQGDLDFEAIRANYMNDIRSMFEESVPPQEERASEIENYLNFKDGSPMPKRNPSYWENAPLLAPITAAETDENVRAILETIKEKESSGNYTVQNQTPGQTASGAYGYTNGTWRMMTEKYGIGTEYKSAKEAPPEVQDIIAANNVREILLENNNDITKVPVIWYTGNAQGKISQKALDVNKGLTPAEYQNDWMRRYNKMLGG